MKYQILDWDSDFFGVKVARITQPRLAAQELSAVLAELKIQQVKLVYWLTDLECDDALVQKLSGKLTDLKTTFAIQFSSVNLNGILSTDVVEPYTDSMPISDLQSLAIQCGEFSRFAVDSDIPKDKFIALYETWIDRSVRKEIADEVLVIRDGVRVVGMVTLGEKNGRGDIGLIAVDLDYRGRKYGERLVRAAQKWFMAQGFKYGQVVTQGQNVPACNLYKKCDYLVEKVEYFYHFWL